MKIIATILCFFSCLVITGQTVNDLRPTVTMKEYVDMKDQMLEEMNKLRDDHQREIGRIKDENIKTAYASQDKRLDGMNEFRETLKDSNSTYVTWQALIGLIIGVSGFLFGYANYKKDSKVPPSSSGSVIRSGDNVEVKK